MERHYKVELVGPPSAPAAAIFGAVPCLSMEPAILATSMFEVVITCRANQCRSPMAEALLRSLVAERGLAVDVRSRGNRPGGAAATQAAVAVMAARGVDLSQHRSMMLSAEDVSRSNLILTMERVLLGEVGRFDARALTRAFTLPEAADLAEIVGQRLPGESEEHWVSLLHGARADRPRPDSKRDDVPDPTERRRRTVRATAASIDIMLRQIIDCLYPAPHPVAQPVDPA